MKYSMPVAQMFAMIRTRIVDAATAAFDTCFFRRGLKRQIADQARSYSELADDFRMLELARIKDHKDEESARAQLCQLRVSPESVRGRTGFMVSAFVPTDVLERLQKGSPQQRNNFQARVSKVLVEHALKGMFRVTAKGTMTAMIFEPLGSASNKRIVSPVFETKDGKHAVDHPPAHSLDVRAIREAQQQQQQQENYGDRMRKKRSDRNNQ